MSTTRSEPVDVLCFLGTRPEIIKFAPVLRTLEDRDRFRSHVVHTNQHYDEELSDVFFRTLELARPDEYLSVGSGSNPTQVADGLLGAADAVQRLEPDVVLVQGDTNAALSGALAAGLLDVPLGHVEAGLRSGDRSMPEEKNRVVVDRLSDLAFAPTDDAAANLADEGQTGRVYVTGNTIVDACRTHLAMAERKSAVRERLSVADGRYAVATIHRPVNTDDPGRLRRVLEALDEQSRPVVFPVHPRTRAAIDELGFEPGGALTCTDPLDYLDFLQLLANARVAVTDSGGIQEETAVLSVPCLTVRPNTERPETTAAGVNRLVSPGELATELSTVFDDDAVYESMTGRTGLFGDGGAGRRVATVLEREFAAGRGPDAGEVAPRAGTRAQEPRAVGRGSGQWPDSFEHD